MISFTIDMNPIPKARPRFSNGHAYTPQRTQSYEEYVGYIASQAMQGQVFETECIAIVLHFKRKGKRLCDIDNLCKACLDAFNGTVWRDDTQVREIHATLEYGHTIGETQVTIIPSE